MKKIAITLFFLISFSNLYSQNGWVVQHTSQYSINSLFFVDENIGYAVGDSGLVIKTTNGGSTWININTPRTHNLKSVHFINANTGCVAGGYGYTGGSNNFYTGSIYKTINGGINWTKIGSTNMYDMPLSVFMISADSILYGSGGSSNTHTEGHLAKTTNGGTNFLQSFSPFNGFQFKSISFANNFIGFALSHYRNHAGAGDDRIYRTTDFGANWTQMYVLAFSNSSQPMLNEVQFLNNITGFVAGINGMVLYTSDGGINWINRGTGTNSYQTVNFINENTGWIGGYKNGNTSGVLKTTNAGLNWQSVTNTYSPNLVRKIHFINSLTGWACGDNIVMKSITGGVVNLNVTSSSLPDKFSLTQNFPNPFNPNTNIKFQLPKSSFVSLKVSDALGREVKNLVNENLSAGEYEVNFNGSDLNSGIYFYKLETEDFNQTRKMILVK